MLVKLEYDAYQAKNIIVDVHTRDHGSAEGKNEETTLNVSMWP